MQYVKSLKAVLISFGLTIAPGTFSHPYEGAPQAAPKSFILHKTDDGRLIYTNIPKKCFSEGRLICHQLHPVFGGPGTIRKPGR